MRPCDGSIAKLYARHDMIIETYRQTTKKWSVDENKHIVSLCGNNHDENSNSPSPNSEVKQFTDSKLISLKQYVGIDSESSIIDNNKIVLPQAHYLNAKIEDIINLDIVNPEIVNFDTTQMGTTAEVCNAFASVLKGICQFVSSNILVIFNSMTVGYHQSKSPENIYLTLRQYAQFQEAMTLASWNICTNYFQYWNGSIEMTGLWFLKRSRSEKSMSVITPKPINERTFGGFIRPFNTNVIEFIKLDTSKPQQTQIGDVQMNFQNELREIKQLITSAEKRLIRLISQKISSQSADSPSKKISSQKIKDPFWVAAGKKAAKRRKQNQKRIAQGLEPLYAKSKKKKVIEKKSAKKIGTTKPYKDPVMVLAGKKSHKRRLENQKRIAQGLEPLYAKSKKRK